MSAARATIGTNSFKIPKMEQEVYFLNVEKKFLFNYFVLSICISRKCRLSRGTYE